MEKESERGNKQCKRTRREKKRKEEKKDRERSGLDYVFLLICTYDFRHGMEK